MTDDTTTDTSEAASAAPATSEPTVLAAPAEKKHRHSWHVWVASAAIAFVIFAAGAHVGFAVGKRFAVRGTRATVGAAAVQQQGREMPRGFGRRFGGRR